ncbi:MAG TPA: DUF998 domain-containing protein [Pyrinomonadaceae bacterium]
MKLSRDIVTVIGLSLICVLQVHCTVGRGLSTPEERVKAITIARALERNPLAKEAAADRQWLLNWIIEVPDIRFKTCVALLSPGVGNHYRYSSEVNQQIIFSAAAFKLEHPDHLRNDTGSYVAGVEGALRAYEMLIKSMPDAQLAFLDNLVAMRDRGELADHVVKLAKEKCKRPKTELILNLAGTGVGLVLSLLVAQWFKRHGAPGVTGSESGPTGHGRVRVARITERVVFLCAAYYVIVLTVLHILEPEFDPRFRFMSEYALGNYGWLMTTTFFVLGLAPFVAAIGLRGVHQLSQSTRIGLGLLVVAAMFIWLAGIFRDSLPHLLAGVVAFPGMVMAVLLLSWTFRRATGWQTIHRVGLFIGLAMLAMLFLMVADVGMPGLQQRVFIFLFLLWLSIVVHESVRLTV